jgi:hypothetical protein
MLSWGVVIAVVALSQGLGAYLDGHFITAAHRDRVRSVLIAVYVWISDTHISRIVIRIARALSGSIATSIYIVLSIAAIVLYIRMSYRALENMTLGNLKIIVPGIDEQNALGAALALTILPNTVLFTSTVRQLTKLVYPREYYWDRDAFNVWVILLFLLYVAVWFWISMSPFSLFYLFAISADFSNAAFPLPLLGFIVYGFAFGMMSMKEFWPVMWLPAIIMVVVALCAIAFVVVFRAIKWIAERFISIASDPARSPYGFFFATVGVILLALKLADEIRKALWASAAATATAVHAP